MLLTCSSIQRKDRRCLGGRKVQWRIERLERDRKIDLLRTDAGTVKCPLCD
jgi:hypothetical protein